MFDFSRYRRRPFPLEVLEGVAEAATRDVDQWGGAAADWLRQREDVPWFWARVVEQDPAAANYRVRAVQPADAGFEDVPEGYESPADIFNAREVNGREDVAAGEAEGAVVQCWPSTHETEGVGQGESWQFLAPGGSGGGGGVAVRRNSAGAVYTRPRLNFIEGSGVTLTVADDAADDEVDITVASTPSLAAFTGARVLVSVSQSITVSETALALTTEDFDAGGLHAGSDAFFTLGVGYWAFGVHVEANIASAGELQIRPHLGGSAYGSGVTGYRPSTAFALRMGMTDVVRVVSGTSQLEFRISRSGGSDFTLAGGRAWVSKIG